MPNTRSEIMKCAVSLFNKKGFFNVSINDIANKMGISPGNLTYHFKRKEHLLEGIQEEILKLGENLLNFEGQHVTMHHYQEIFEKSFEIQKGYQFYFSEINYFLTEYPHIIARYKKDTYERLKKGRKLIDYYIHTERLIPEGKQVDYTMMIYNLWTLNRFWSLSALQMGIPEEEVNDPDLRLHALWAVILPYLTDKGFKEYLEITNSKYINRYY